MKIKIFRCIEKNLRSDKRNLKGKEIIKVYKK